MKYLLKSVKFPTAVLETVEVVEYLDNPMAPTPNLHLERTFNFSSGPAVLPEEVLEQVRDDLLNYKGTGMSVMEMSHRCKAFDEILAHALTGIRDTLSIPNDYEVLFLQGGASLQFAMVPLNLAFPGKPVEVIHTGNWTKMAIDEVKKIGIEHSIPLSTESTNFATLPNLSRYKPQPNASYVHLCSNNTIEGTQFKSFPLTGDTPLVCDMSSDILARPIDVSKFGLIFAGAQKNIGPAGVTLVIIRKDLAERAAKNQPTLMQYRSHIQAGSRYNTPPTFGIYICGLVMDWLKARGGVTAMEKANTEKASLIYDVLDRSGGFYHCPVPQEFRSPMNLVWRIQPGTADQEAIETAFVREAAAQGLHELKGHRSVGGLRASLYNAQPRAGVEALAAFMKEFARKRG
jgi:phosphoserine aminotransferase